MGLDSSLYTDVSEKLRFELNIDDSDITVAIKSSGIVVLAGKVKSYTEKRLAEEAVEKIEAVRGIANKLEVYLSASYRRDDADIVKAALNTLKWIYFIPYKQIKIAVEKGHLIMDGEVEYNCQKERAQSAVQDLYGVTFVTNNLKVKPSITPFEVKEKITKEFECNTCIDANNIQVEVDGGKVTLKGRVKNFDEDKEARAASWSVPGVSSVLDQLKITW